MFEKLKILSRQQRLIRKYLKEYAELSRKYKDLNQKYCEALDEVVKSKREIIDLTIKVYEKNNEVTE